MNHTHGILIVCNAQFIVEEVVFNGLETDIHLSIGKSFLNLIIPADHKKANELIQTVKIGKSEFNWELNLLPYHRYGVSKYDWLGMKYELQEVAVPSRERLEELSNYFRSHGAICSLGGGEIKSVLTQ